MVIINPIHIGQKSENNFRYSSIQNNVSRVQHEINEQFRVCERQKDIVERKSKRNASLILKTLKARNKQLNQIPFSKPRKERSNTSDPFPSSSAATFFDASDVDLLQSSTKKSSENPTALHAQYDMPLSQRFPNAKFDFDDFSSFHEILEDMDPNSPYYHELLHLLHTDDVQDQLHNEQTIMERDARATAASMESHTQNAQAQSHTRLKSLKDKFKRHSMATQHIMQTMKFGHDIHEQRKKEREESSITHQIQRKLWQNDIFRAEYEKNMGPSAEQVKQAEHHEYLDHLMGMTRKPLPEDTSRPSASVPSLNLDHIESSRSGSETSSTSGEPNSARKESTHPKQTSRHSTNSPSRPVITERKSGEDGKRNSESMHSSRSNKARQRQSARKSSGVLNSSRSTSNHHVMNLHNPLPDGVLDKYIQGEDVNVEVVHEAVMGGVASASRTQRKEELSNSVTDDDSEKGDWTSDDDAIDAGSDGRLRANGAPSTANFLPPQSKRPYAPNVVAQVSNKKHKRRRTKRSKAKSTKRKEKKDEQSAEATLEEQRHLNLLSVAAGVDSGVDVDLDFAL
mmetsp:Transcript_10336/g.38378  ORF Transcript_10336/g.38378 Transcript_10336/m.38378 type:complete len:569 (-) Transcript_10336:426-2132(-)